MLRMFCAEGAKKHDSGRLSSFVHPTGLLRCMRIAGTTYDASMGVGEMRVPRAARVRVIRGYGAEWARELSGRGLRMGVE